MGLKRNKKKSRPFHQVIEEPQDEKTGPRILVINRGSVGAVIPQLMTDIRTLLSPNVVRSIKVLRSTRVQDLVAAAGPLHITHAIVFTRTDNGVYMKICTLSHGPTVTFSLQNFSLHSDVLASLKRPMTIPTLYNQTAACLMMNNLQPHSGPRHLQMVASSMLQIFPKIVPDEISARRIRRCCMINYDEETQDFDLRHYFVHLSTSTTTKLINKLVNSMKIPDLHEFENMEDAMDRAGALSESEGEEDSKVEVARQINGQNRKPVSAKSSVKMKDCGPRITMKLQKIESGLLGGDVLYHRTQKKSAKEVQQIKMLREQKKKEKDARKQRQEEDVARKQEKGEQHKEMCLQGQSAEEQDRAHKNKLKKNAEDNKLEDDDDDSAGEGDDEEESDDDAEYYKQEVGDLPEGVSFSSRMKRRREKDTEEMDAKKQKVQTLEEKKIEARKLKAKEKFKELNKKSKKRPRSYGKRLVKQMKRQAKARTAFKTAEKAKEMKDQANKPIQKKF
uniref:Suppressor of SWI4 1 homolog n=1 Tax=Hirondellea gigas TaxID=1518452 RepID=A0A2P2I279_9CRUS